MSSWLPFWKLKGLLAPEMSKFTKIRKFQKSLYVMRSMKRDLKSANLILQGNKKTKFTSKLAIFVFLQKWEKHQNIYPKYKNVWTENNFNMFHVFALTYYILLRCVTHEWCASTVWRQSLRKITRFTRCASTLPQMTRNTRFTRRASTLPYSICTTHIIHY